MHFLFFCTFPVTVSGAERVFIKLQQISHLVCSESVIFYATRGKRAEKVDWGEALPGSVGSWTGGSGSCTGFPWSSVRGPNVTSFPQIPGGAPDSSCALA